MALSTLLLCFVAVVTTAHGQSTQGYISVDCGHAGQGYRDSTGLFLSPDESYIGTGVNMNISVINNFAQCYGDLRSFPHGTRNCYTLPVQRDVKYLVRAGFVYGNYDGLNQTPVFDLFLGVNFWKRVRADSVVEVVAVATAVSMQVCLVNNGTGTPFISTLELRPLADSMYPQVNASRSLVLHQIRYNYGGPRDAQIRYPDDPYDRIWYTPDYPAGWKPLSSDNSTAQVNPEPNGEFLVPSVVLRTAVTTASLSGRLNFTVTSSLGDKIYLVIHFAELQQLRANESRVFDVYKDSDLWYEACRPKYLQAGTIYTTKPGAGGTYAYSLAATGKYSTLPPILNALEVYTLLRMTQLPTDERDETRMKQTKRVDNHRQKDSLQTQSHHFKFSDILSITHNFERAIGKGGFGIVYLGYLPDSTQVAVKLLSQSSSQGAKEFQAEALVLTRVHHKNIVSLLGYCNDKNYLALVYEFMPQGSLATHLYGCLAQSSTDTIKGLSWTMRLTIALDSAQGLDYLHNGCKPSIVHRDVKTANILLNENFGAKLADFGLSRAFINEEDTHLSTAVAGTPGYLDPEYYQSYRLNEKSDIYSFGVVLLELITGRTPIFGAEKIHIIQWVLSRIEGDIDSIADHRLQRNYDTNSIWKAVDIAMACASSPSTQRPTMSEVVVQLKECLALEAGTSYSDNFRMQSPHTMEILPLNLDQMISPSAR